MNDIFVTVTGLNHYLGTKPFKVGRILRLEKDTENQYDTEAVKVELPYIGTIGYIANSANTVYAGTHSAGKLYDNMGKHAYASVMFITHSSVIARVMSADESAENDSVAALETVFKFLNENDTEE